MDTLEGIIPLLPVQKSLAPLLSSPVVGKAYDSLQHN